MDETTPAPAPSPPSVPAPKGGIPKAIWLVVGAVIVAVAIAGVIIFMNRQYSIEGSLRAPECGGGYDIESASVQIRDQNNQLIGSTSTGLNENFNPNPTAGCSVSFETEVPKAAFYQITVGTHGGPSYSFEEMEANDWKLELSLD